MLNRNFLACIFLFISGAPLFAEGPSYEETKFFVLEKTQVRFSGGNKTQELNFPSKCVVIRKIKWIDGNGKVDTIDTLTVNLSDIDPTKTVQHQNFGGGIALLTFKNKQLVKQRSEHHFYYANGRNVHGEAHSSSQNAGYSCRNNICYKSSTEKVFPINTFEASDNAPRLERALNHLVKICGGKKELF